MSQLSARGAWNRLIEAIATTEGSDEELVALAHEAFEFAGLAIRWADGWDNTRFRAALTRIHSTDVPLTPTNEFHTFTESYNDQ